MPPADPLVRIFTPADELPFAGHPLVGTAWVLSHLGPGGSGRLRTAVGTVEYETDGESVMIRSDIAIDVIEPNDVASVAIGASMPEPIASVRLGLPKEYCIAQYETFARSQPWFRTWTPCTADSGSLRSPGTATR